MSDQPDLSTLPARMRYASGVIDEASAEYHRRSPEGSWLARNWRSTDLVSYADLWEREDRAADEHKAQVESLADIIVSQLGQFAGGKTLSRLAARIAIDAGWRKEESGA